MNDLCVQMNKSFIIRQPSAIFKTNIDKIICIINCIYNKNRSLNIDIYHVINHCFPCCDQHKYCYWDINYEITNNDYIWFVSPDGKTYFTNSILSNINEIHCYEFYFYIDEMYNNMSTIIELQLHI